MLIQKHSETNAMPLSDVVSLHRCQSVFRCSWLNKSQKWLRWNASR